MKFWDAYAGKSGKPGEIYDGLLEASPYRRVITQVADALERAMEGRARTGTRCLDVGCGTGNFLAELVRRGMFESYVGLDGSTEMLAAASNKLGFETRFIQTDLTRPLPVDAESFDAVICVQVLYALPDAAATIKAMMQALKPGGTLVIVNAHTLDPMAVLRTHYREASLPTSLREIVREIRRFIRFLRIIALNLVIIIQGKRQVFHPLTEIALIGMVSAAGGEVADSRSDAYGRTSVFLIAQKPAR